MKEQVIISSDGLVEKNNSINPRKKHSRVKKVLVIEQCFREHCYVG